MPLVCGLLWLVDNGLFEGHKYSQKLDQFMLANVWSGGGWFWAWVVIGAFVSAFIVFFIFLKSFCSFISEMPFGTNNRISPCGWELNLKAGWAEVLSVRENFSASHPHKLLLRFSKITFLLYDESVFERDCRIVADADQPQWRFETQGRERADGHAVVASVGVTRRNDRDTSRESTEDRPEQVNVDGHAAGRRVEPA